MAATYRFESSHQPNSPLSEAGSMIRAEQTAIRCQQRLFSRTGWKYLSTLLFTAATLNLLFSSIPNPLFFLLIIPSLSRELKAFPHIYKAVELKLSNSEMVRLFMLLRLKPRPIQLMMQRDGFLNL